MVQTARVLALASLRSMQCSTDWCAQVQKSWPDDETRPEFSIQNVEVFDPERISSFDVLLIIADPEMDRERRIWRGVIETAEETSIPSVAVFHGERLPLLLDQESVLCCPASVESASFALQLQAVLHQSVLMRKMKRELTVSRRFQGGLKGEITRMHEEMQLAAMVQRDFLPRELPTLHGVTFGAIWRPANYVSGDIYDVQRLDEDHVGVFVADAVGHGVPAALMTMVIARALPVKEVSDSAYRIVSPSEALSRLNEEMIRRQADSTRFATAVYAVINCRDRTARIASAGHPAPLLLRGSEEMREIRAIGGLLGVFEDETFDEVEFELHAEDRLLFYSDGFELAFPDQSGNVHEKRLPTQQYLAEFASLTQFNRPEDMTSRILERLNAHPGSLHQVDDLTLVCVHAAALRGRTNNAARGASSVGVNPR